MYLEYHKISKIIGGWRRNGPNKQSLKTVDRVASRTGILLWCDLKEIFNGVPVCFKYFPRKHVWNVTVAFFAIRGVSV